MCALVRGHDPLGQRAGRGPEFDSGILGIEPALDGVAARGHLILAEGEGLAAGDAQLGGHQVDAGDHLGDRMLDLDTRVHLQEIEILARGVDDEFHRSRTPGSVAP